MPALKKPVWQEKTSLATPNSRVAAISKAWHDSGSLLFSSSIKKVREGTARRVVRLSPARCHGLLETSCKLRLFTFGLLISEDQQSIEEEVSIVYQCLSASIVYQVSVKKCKGAIVTTYNRNLMKEIACKCQGQHLIIKQEFAPDSDAQNKSYVEMLNVQRATQKWGNGFLGGKRPIGIWCKMKLIVQWINE